MKYNFFQKQFLPKQKTTKKSQNPFKIGFRVSRNIQLSTVN